MPDTRRRDKFRFGIVHLLYAVAVLGVALATFGASGLILSLIVLAAWAFVFSSRSRSGALLIVGLFLVCGFCLFGLLLPSISPAREAARRMQCHNNLKQIMLAVYTYYDDYGSFPPACVTDSQGQPLHSWRVLILPYLEQEALYAKYRFDEPWNGPNNRQLAESIPEAYQCPELRTRTGTGTSYLAVTGPDAAWQDSEVRLFRDFKDGTSNTILILESDAPVHWMEPRDVPVEQALQLLIQVEPVSDKPHRYENFFFVEMVGRNAAFADSHVQFLGLPLSRRTATGLLNRTDGIAPSDAESTRPPTAPRILRTDNCLRLALFVLLTFLPLPWALWRKAPPPERPAEETLDSP